MLPRQALVIQIIVSSLVFNFSITIAITIAGDKHLIGSETFFIMPNVVTEKNW